MDEDMVTDLAAQQAKTASDLRELSGVVSEIGGEVSSTAEQLHQVERGLATVTAAVERVAEHLGLDDKGDDDAAPVAWHTLNRDDAQEQWDKLLTWVDEVLCPTYGITRGQLPDCWTRHPAMRNELAWLRTCHVQAYMPGGHAGGAAEWHLRYLPGALQRIALVARRWGQNPPDAAWTPDCGKGGCWLGEDLPQPWEHDNVALQPATRAVWDLAAVKRDIDSRPAPAAAADPPIG